MRIGEVLADVVVVGGGNAALCAALAAGQQGAEVVVLEAAGQNETGGNSWFSDGAMRFAFDSFGQLQTLLQLSDADAAKLEVPLYSADDYFNAIARRRWHSEKLMRRGLLLRWLP